MNMENKMSSGTNQSPKALFLLCLLPLSTIVSLISGAFRWEGYVGYFFEVHFFEDLIFFSVLLSFLFIKTKRTVALSFSVIATVFQLLSSIINFVDMSIESEYTVHFSFNALLEIIPYRVFPILLCVLLVIYCVSPRSSRCYLFSGIIGCGILILNVNCIFFGNPTPADQGMAVLFLLGFLTNSDVAAQVIKPKQKNTNISSALDKLEKFAQLKEQGILTAEEFEAKKQELMNQM